MALKSGQYHIHTFEGAPVGRYPTEDKSLLPKPVYGLGFNFEAQKWSIERVSKDRYKLSIGGAYTAEIDGKLFAVLLDEPKPVEWVLRKHEQYGTDTYTIEESGENIAKGWVVPTDPQDDDAVQIEVGLLKSNPSIPPYYPPNQLFKIEEI